MPSLLPVLVKHSLGNATALTRYSSQHLRNGRCEAPTYLAEEDLQPLGDLARTYSRDVKRWLGFTIPSNPDQGNNLWIFRALLAQLGIETDARRQGRSQRRSVWITAQNWDLVQQILQRRQERRDCVVTPSIYK